jgi:hypothetical protein
VAFLLLLLLLWWRGRVVPEQQLDCQGTQLQCVTRTHLVVVTGCERHPRPQPILEQQCLHTQQ